MQTCTTYSSIFFAKQSVKKVLLKFEFFHIKIDQTCGVGIFKFLGSLRAIKLEFIDVSKEKKMFFDLAY